MVDNSLSEQEKFQEEKTQKLLDTVRAYKSVFNGEGGKLVLEDMEKTCFFSKTTYTPEGHSMAYREGRRSVILDIKKILQKDEAEILKLFKQISQREEEEEMII